VSDAAGAFLEQAREHDATSKTTSRIPSHGCGEPLRMKQ
jgi:hypothetical protein